jgi:hypothetical protein
MLLLVIPAVTILSAGTIYSIIKFIPIHRPHSSNLPIVIERKKLQTHIRINGTSYNFFYEVDKIGLHNSAIEFCSNYGENFGVTVKNFNSCVDSIIYALTQYDPSVSARMVQSYLPQSPKTPIDTANQHISSAFLSSQSEAISSASSPLGNDNPENANPQSAANFMVALTSSPNQTESSKMPQEQPRASLSHVQGMEHSPTFLIENMHELKETQSQIMARKNNSTEGQVTPTKITAYLNYSN